MGVIENGETCCQYNIEKAQKKMGRRKADRIVAEQVFSQMLADDTFDDDKTFALMTACCMVSTITFEKFFNRVSKIIRGCKDKGKAKKTKKSLKQEKKKKKNNDQLCEKI